ncbi:MAG: AarF/ABC1/UbiB kinase family protein [Oligoflexia bacterium]|nr:AarF/ABC1/UbiB kinase family protein [Oligoflexia bacterium]
MVFSLQPIIHFFILLLWLSILPISIFISTESFSVDNSNITTNTSNKNNNSNTTIEDTKKIRNFAYLLLAATQFSSETAPNTITENKNNFDSEKMQLALEAFPDVLQMIYDGKDLNEILKQAELPQVPSFLNYFFTKVPSFFNLFSTITNIVDFPKIISSIFPKDSYLSIPINLISNMIIKLENKGLLNTLLIDKNSQTTTAKVNNDGKKIGILMLDALSDLIINKLRLDNSIRKSEKIKFINLLPSPFFSHLSNILFKKISNIKFSEYNELSILHDPNSGIDTSFMPKKIAEFLNLVLVEYFDRMHAEDKKKIIMALLDSPANSTEEDKLLVVINNVGPGLQKLLQLIANYAKSPKLVSILEKLKSNIKPFDGKLAKSIVEKNLGSKYSEIISEFNEKPLAAASVGQVHLAKLHSGQEVIVKVIRPNLRERAQREIELLKSIAKNDEVLVKFIDDTATSLKEELDFNFEGQNVKEGIIYSDPQKGIYPLKLITDKDGQDIFTSDVILMEKAPGKPMSKYKGEKLDLKTAKRKITSLSNFLSMWFDEAIFKSGFFHGDLHEGNLFFEPSAAKLTKTKKSKKLPKVPDFQIVPIDFGSVGKLNQDEREQMIHLFLSVYLQLPQNAANVFKSLSPLMTKDQYKKLIEYSKNNIFKKGSNVAIFQAIGMLINKIMEMGIALPKSFVKFNRAITFMENQIYYTNQELDTIDPKKKIARGNSIAIYQSIIKSRLLANIIRNFLGLSVKKDSPIGNNLLSSLKQEYLYGKCDLSKLE